MKIRKTVRTPMKIVKRMPIQPNEEDWLASRTKFNTMGYIVYYFPEKEN